MYIIHYRKSDQKCTFISSSLSAPYDVTLKLSDGEIIKAHKMILAAASPVFNRMFYGNFKESKLDEVNLQEENSNMMKLFVDFIYNGDCKLENLSDVLPLMKVVDYYQINNVPFLLKCGKVILAELDSANYLNLLPKFACVMSEESIQKAADKVMCYCKCDFISKFDETKDLPEEVIFYLLQRNDIQNPEIEIFDFLVKWYEYQTKELNNTLKLVPQLFHTIRYSVINPQLLHDKVAKCIHVDKQVLTEALDHLSKPLELHQDCKCGECYQESTRNLINRPRYFNDIKWLACLGTTISYHQNAHHIQYNAPNSHTNCSNVQILHSGSLRNGAYSFSIPGPGQVSMSISCQGNYISQLCTLPVTGCKVTIFVFKNYIFVKTLQASYTFTDTPPFCLSVIVNTDSVSFQIVHDL